MQNPTIKSMERTCREKLTVAELVKKTSVLLMSNSMLVKASCNDFENNFVNDFLGIHSFSPKGIDRMMAEMKAKI
jgi:hypothetical protein